MATETWTFAVPPALSATELCESMHLASEGAPEQDTCTVPAKAPPEARTREYIADEPAFTVTETGETWGTKSGGPAQPVSTSRWVPVLALSVNVRLPLSSPFDIGVNVT